MTSSARQAFERHTAAIRERDLEAVVAGYAPDAVLAEADRIGRGLDHIRAVHAETLEAAAALEPSLEVHEAGDVVYVSWHADPPGGPELRGTNTFVITDGLIVVNTTYMTTVTGQPARLGEAVR